MCVRRAPAVAARATRFLPSRRAAPVALRGLERGGRQRREHGRHVLRDAALELDGDARGGVLRGRRTRLGRRGQQAAVARRAPAHVMRPILAHPRLERLVEQRALHSVPERHERTVRTHALVLHARLGRSRAEGNDAHVRVWRGGATEADLLGFELRLARVDGAQAPGPPARGGGRGGVLARVGGPRRGRAGAGRHL